MPCFALVVLLVVLAVVLLVVVVLVAATVCFPLLFCFLSFRPHLTCPWPFFLLVRGHGPIWFSRFGDLLRFRLHSVFLKALFTVAQVFGVVRFSVGL